MTRRIVITGAAGRIGRRLRIHFSASLAYKLVLIDRDNQGDAEIHSRDLSRYDTEWTDLIADADTVIHLAADPRPAAPWDAIAKNNIQATINLFRAAAVHGVRRVVYASSVQTLEGYRYSRGPIGADAPPRPTTFYAASKLMEEMTARYFWDAHGLSVICLRLGSVQTGHSLPNRDWTIWGQSKWLSGDDLCQGVEKAVLVDDVGYAVLPLFSDNAGMRWDLSETRRVLGYAPTKFGVPPSPRFAVQARSVFRFLHRRFLHPAWRYYWD